MMLNGNSKPIADRKIEKKQNADIIWVEYSLKSH